MMGNTGSDALGESAEQLRLAVESAELGIWEFDPVTQVITCSERYRQIFGLPPDVPVDYTTFLDCLHPEDRQRIHEVVQRALDPATGGCYKADYRIYRPDGAERWISAGGQAFFGLIQGQRRAVRFIGNVLDITEHQQRERELERLNRLYATLSEVNRTITRVTSREALLHDVCRITVGHADFKVVWIGWLDPETRKVRPVARAGDSEGYLDKINVYADDRPEGCGPVGICIREGKACIFNNFPLDPRARPWRAAATAHGLLAVAALPICVNGMVCGAYTVYSGETDVFRDREVALLEEIAASISFALEHLDHEVQRRRVEEALRESEARFRSYLEYAPLAVFVVDRQGRYVDFNPAALDMLGYDAATLAGLSIPDIVPEEDLELALNGFTVLMEAGHFEAEFRLKGRDGRLVWVSLRSVKINDNRFMAFCHDIAERRRAEAALAANAQLAGANAALAEADRRKDEFLAMLAHELRNPLAPIRNAVDILRLAGAADPRMQRQREIIGRQVTHMARLLDDLLDVSRITLGKIDLRLRPLPLAEVLQQAVETATPLIQSRRHTMEFTPPPLTLRVQGDFDRLTQALGNLLANAAKYTEVGGRIWLETTCGAGEAVIRIRDTGVGIAPEMLPRIFELFAQADRSLDRAQGGLGIGLTMARALIRMHGGAIEVCSAGPGKGSEFTIRLPALPAGEPAGPVPLAPEPALPVEPARHRVLVVDDVADTSESMAELLETWGHEASAIYDGLSAVGAAREFRPDVVLLDIGLPGMDGYQVARRLREEFGAALLLVALTGYGQERDRRQALEAGFNHHLVKPVDLTVLRNLLADFRH